MRKRIRVPAALLALCAMLLCGSLTDRQTGPLHRHRPVVLMYHLVEEEPFTENRSLFVTPEDFEAQLAALQKAGYTFLFADEYRYTEAPSVILTFDDGYADNAEIVLPLLQQYGARATVFAAAGLLGRPHYLTETQLRTMAESGCFRIGAHTVSHGKLPELPPEAAEAELRDAQAELERITGAPVRSMSYPNGKQNAAVRALAAQYYDFAYTIRSPLYVTRCTALTIPRINVKRGMDAESLLRSVGAAGRLCSVLR